MSRTSLTAVPTSCDSAAPPKTEEVHRRSGISPDELDAGACERYQDAILSGVSRTFALTIPELPGTLRRIVTNAYLLCRIADTIEDDSGIDPTDKRRCHELFIAALEGRIAAREFVASVSPRISERALPEERDLVANSDKVLHVTFGFSDETREILVRRIGTMCRGMPQFQLRPQPNGLENLEALDRYCYYVAGVVGEMLTELFCAHSAAIARKRDIIEPLAASFGQGLQMTNILKDVWDDHESGVCWLPRDIFCSAGYDLDRLAPDHSRDDFSVGLGQLVGIAHGHLRNALEYTLSIPSDEAGVRRFCLWSIGLAVLTLRRINRNPGYRSGGEVKVSRGTVRATVFVTGALARRDATLRQLFRWAARGLPLVEHEPGHSPHPDGPRGHANAAVEDTGRANA